MYHCRTREIPSLWTPIIVILKSGCVISSTDLKSLSALVCSPVTEPHAHHTASAPELLVCVSFLQPMGALSRRHFVQDLPFFFGTLGWFCGCLIGKYEI